MRTSPTSATAEIAAPSNSDGRWPSVRSPRAIIGDSATAAITAAIAATPAAIARAAGRSGTSCRASTAPTLPAT